MQDPATILVVDDDREIRSLLERVLKKHGFRVKTAADGRTMREALAGGRVDLVLLDVMLPGEDGLALCRELRATSAVPVVMVSALGEETDRIVGLEIGADDYLPKPFNGRELTARIRAVLRRTAASAPPGLDEPERTLSFEGWVLNLARRELRTPAGEAVDLTAAEFDLLAVLAQRPGRVLSRDQLLDLTRGRTADVFDRSVDIHVSRIRKKIEADPREPALIKTVRSGGYVFAVPVATG